MEISLVAIISWRPLDACWLLQTYCGSSNSAAKAPTTLQKGPCRANYTGTRGIGMPRAPKITPRKMAHFCWAKMVPFQNLHVASPPKHFCEDFGCLLVIIGAF